jgi:hypothetical protein
MKISVAVSLKLKLQLQYDPALPLLGIYPKDCKSAGNCFGGRVEANRRERVKREGDRRVNMVEVVHMHV